LVPLGMCLKMCLLNKDIVEKNFDNEFSKYEIKKNKIKIVLNPEQKKSLSFLRSLGNNYQVAVLEGITGSGKTLVYFKRVKDLIDKGFQTLIMLPEIALTNQFSSMKVGIQQLQKKIKQ
jgi:primosomal protein N' (replication factor Y)